ncbi:MAG: hypothetical protein JW940_01585 [Polyangiaceae bacterium]|nr:hypothetical protein [Polyangiaceae bacterium]
MRVQTTRQGWTRGALEVDGDLRHSRAQASGMSRGGGSELVGRPRTGDKGRARRLDLILGNCCPNQAIILLTSDGQRFPDFRY